MFLILHPLNSLPSFLPSLLPSFLSIQAIDSDERQTPRSFVQYSIIDGNIDATFDVDPTSGQIFAVRPIDYETLRSRLQGGSGSGDDAAAAAAAAAAAGIELQRPYFNLTLEARDAFGLSSRTSVLIDVRDRNDNAPVFERAVYSASLREDAAPGTRVVNVSAIDIDSPAFNGHVVYRIDVAASSALTGDGDAAA